MFNALDVTAEQTRLHQQELRDMAAKLHKEQPSTGSPVLAALGRRLVVLGEKLQHSAHMPEQNALELQTKQA